MTFKEKYCPELYLTKCMSRRRRSLMSQLRAGILPIEIEKGRYTPIFDKTIKKNRKREAKERVCKLCNLNAIEDEFHFICICPLFVIPRTALFAKLRITFNDFPSLSLPEQFIYLMTHCQIEISRYLAEIWSIRQTSINT